MRDNAIHPMEAVRVFQDGKGRTVRKALAKDTHMDLNANVNAIATRPIH